MDGYFFFHFFLIFKLQKKEKFNLFYTFVRFRKNCKKKYYHHPFFSKKIILCDKIKIFAYVQHSRYTCILCELHNFRFNCSRKFLQGIAPLIFIIPPYFIKLFSNTPFFKFDLKQSFDDSSIWEDKFVVNNSVDNFSPKVVRKKPLD